MERDRGKAVKAGLRGWVAGGSFRPLGWGIADLVTALLLDFALNTTNNVALSASLSTAIQDLVEECAPR